MNNNWHAPATPARNHGAERRRNVLRRHDKLKKDDQVRFKHISNGRYANGTVINKATFVPPALQQRFQGQNFWKIRNMNKDGVFLIPLGHIYHVNR
jgi:hypothetical protein